MTTSIPPWRRWVPRVATLTSAFTVLCCLGVTAALSLMTAIGATFMTQDKYLQPILAATLLLTVVGSALTLLAHRNPLPLLLTAGSSAWVFLTIFGSNLFSQAGTSDGHGGGNSGHSGDNLWAWSGLAVLIATQVWDLWLVRGRRRTAAT